MQGEGYMGPWGLAWDSEKPWGLGFVVEGPAYDIWFCAILRLGPLQIDLFLEKP